MKNMQNIKSIIDKKEKKKQFECASYQRFVEMVVLGCPKCITKYAPLLTQKQKEKIFNILK